MSFLKSIRFRLAAWYTVMLLIGLAAFSAILAFSGHYALTQSLDSRLEDRVSRLAEPLGRDYEENEQAIFRLTEQPELAAWLRALPEDRLEALEAGPAAPEDAPPLLRTLYDAAAALTACGIKGPLYLPDGRTTAGKTAETPADHNKPRQEAPQ